MKTKIITSLFGAIFFISSTMPIISHHIPDIEKLNGDQFKYLIK